MLRNQSENSSTPFRKRSVGLLLCLACALPAPFVHVTLAAQDRPPVIASFVQSEVDLAGAIGEIKDLQYTYAHYGQFGLWDEMTTLFADDAEIIIGERTIQGREAIASHLASFTDGRQGLPPGWLNTELYMAPVVTLATDGRHATGRWQNLNMRGQMGGEAAWSGGFHVNDYVYEAGVWKFSTIRVVQQFSGDYERGWFADGGVIPFLPYHYSSREAGAPIPEEASMFAAPHGDELLSPADLSQLARQVERMTDEDRVRNLQNQYGYYADRKMWDDVADLFAPDGALEIAGTGIYDGAQSIRRGLERDGPAGLQNGQVNDQIQLHVIVEVDPDGVVAHARGMQLGMLTPRMGEAFWMVSTFDNRYVKMDGQWRILEMRIYPMMKADYYQGWHRSQVIDAAPEPSVAPDRSSGLENSPQVSPVIPAFFTNPVTGAPVTYPQGFAVIGSDDLVALADMEPRPAAPLSPAEQSALIARQLDVVRAYDAIENISSTFGYYLDDYQWQRYVENYAEDGWRRKGGGEVYIGREAIFRAETASYGPSPTTMRDWVRLHTRLQPVINISEDGEAAFIRTRMLLYFANSRSPGSFNSGMYPSDSAVLEDGVWKMRVGGWIDETYFNSQSYALGWAHRAEGGGLQEGRGAPSDRALDPALIEARRNFRYPPDRAPDQLGRRAHGVVRGAPGFASWPDIKPMWFHYVNPVSGRVPEYYCADVTICVNE